MSLLLYCVTLLIIILSFVHCIVYLFHLSFLYTKDNPTQEYHSYRPIKNAPIPIYPKNIQVTLSERNRPLPNYLYKLVDNNTTVNLNISYYFLNILASPDVLTWLITGGPITKTIKHLGLTKHQQNIVEITLCMVNWCK